jgi:hypothetical protein
METKVIMITASESNPLLGRLCEQLVPGGVPQLLPLETSADAEELDCFYNAARVAALDGGSVIYGWALYEWPGKFLEAQFHAVLRRSTGQLVDVSPSTGSNQQTLFLPDPHSPYEPGRRRSSVQLSCSGDSEVRRYMKVFADVQAMDEEYFVDQGPGGVVGVAIPPELELKYEGVPV